ncbi:hypothetical protein O0881_21510 [Janthinobacterium sp. SUN100]|uniref:hypothetical protein n=1 Tax=Janthinobacterium sp. SUN100 TaxID=3004101 RepID=UPI0025AF6CA3|nr:hypothetical protein [Janthinobacterium sp. SUN100]MDN2704564.1 hypothetical protein [Janthinobacterium sp. SUN100]
MFSGVRFFVVAMLFLFSFSTNARDLHILVMQEGGAADCREAPHEKKVQGVYLLDLNGQETPARLSTGRTDCAADNISVLLGQKMIQTGIAERVFFMSISASGEHVHDWLTGGALYKDLQLAVKAEKLKKIKFDYALWQGWFIDEKLTESQYNGEVRRAVKSVSLDMKVEKWIIGRNGKCGQKKTAHTSSVKWEVLLNRFPGPDIGQLNDEYYSGNCGMNELGQNALAQLWFDTIKSVDIASGKYQRESLLYYFK